MASQVFVTVWVHGCISVYVWVGGWMHTTVRTVVLVFPPFLSSLERMLSTPGDFLLSEYAQLLQPLPSALSLLSLE